MKTWWKGEPLIVGSVRWLVIRNDLLNEMRALLKLLKPETTIEEAAKLAHKRDLKISFKIVPKK